MFRRWRITFLLRLQTQGSFGLCRNCDLSFTVQSCVLSSLCASSKSQVVDCPIPALLFSVITCAVCVVVFLKSALVSRLPYPSEAVVASLHLLTAAPFSLTLSLLQCTRCCSSGDGPRNARTHGNGNTARRQQNRCVWRLLLS